MGNKGFTLIELLATIVLLGLAFGIASYGVVGMVEKSRMKSEGIFIEKLGDAIDEYIDMYGSGLVKGSEEYNFYKCHDTGSCDDASNGSYKVVANELDNITIRELIEKGFLVEEDLVKDAGIIYTVIKFKKGFSFYTKKQLYFGPCLMKENNELFIEKNKLELKKMEKFYPVIPKNHIHHRAKISFRIKQIKKLLKS